jgi:hypothetical protein
VTSRRRRQAGGPATLFQIERLAGVVDGELVPIRNGSDARWARDATGRTWVRKREVNTGANGLLAEAASYLLGDLLGVRQPRAAVFHDGDEWSWMSERLVAAGEHWNPDQRDLIANVEEVGRMVALDALTLNEDRHAQNLLVEPLADGAHLRVWAIDSGNALIGTPVDFCGRGVEPPNPSNHARGLPILALTDGAMAAAEVAAALPADRITVLMREACALAREPAEEALKSALVTRCVQARTIVARYLDLLGTHR